MVTSAVADPVELGVDPERLQALLERVAREVDAGLLPSCQLALARGGRLAAFAAFGDATSDTRYTIYSCTKAIVASAVWLLMAEGALDVSKRVAEYIPEFGTNGKDVVTVEQVLLHTAGFPHAPLAPELWHDRAGRLERFAAWRLNWEPGTAYEYHATSAHWVLAELIHRLGGLDHRQFVADRVASPLGLQGLRVGLPTGEQDGVAEVVLCGEPPTPDELEATLGVRELPVGEVTDENLLLFNDPVNRAAGVPGAGGIMTAADLALFYQALLHDPGGLWDADVLADATGHVRNQFPDPLLRVSANRGLGVVIAGDDGLGPFRGFGATVSARAFGHGGAGGQIAWADPQTGLSLAYLTNGIDANILRQARRGMAISSRAGVCVGV